MRHHRRVLSCLFRQFASASSSVQHLEAITVVDLATTATVTTATAVIGAGIIITGIDNFCVAAAEAVATHRKRWCQS